MAFLIRPTGRQVVKCAALTGAIFLTLGAVRILSFGKAPPLEFRFGGYSPNDVDDLFAQLGSAGRTTYTWLEAADLILIALLAGTLVQAGRWSVQRTGSSGSNFLGLLVWLPLAYAIADIGEDVAIVSLIRTYPAQNDGLSRGAAALTATKFVLLLASAVTVAVAVYRAHDTPR